MWGRKSSVGLVGALALGAIGLAGCATTDYVDEQVAQVDTMVQGHETTIGALDKTTQEALARATAAGKLAEGKFLYSVVLTDESVKFGFDKHELSPQAEAALAQVAEKLRQDNRNVYIEIQGHTDAVGPPTYNEELGAERAEAVRRYLNRQGIALNRLATISYGETVPVAPNETQVGRAQNRRVVLVVLV
jgi:peptidoglycan-associated lipoprotein